MSNWFKFTYCRYLEKDQETGEIYEIYRPTVPLQISYKGKISFGFQTLVDSGSDRNLFPASLGESIGIDIKKGPKRIIRGIGGFTLTAYFHNVKVHIAGYDFETEVDFSFEHPFPLLGRMGFFRFFKKIEFKEKEQSIEFRIR
ncbi:hypothetical protein HY008_02345 [Candidatus Woesebacteria bacterium]|nr:hypothetical protein [Candidatus Woesebacteria bacterium]